MKRYQGLFNSFVIGQFWWQGRSQYESSGECSNLSMIGMAGPLEALVGACAPKTDEGEIHFLPSTALEE